MAPAASSSSSSSRPNTNEVLNPENFDVFISFRGKDTRYKFTSHVHSALERKLIKAFIDSEDLRSGDEISGALLKAIEGSKLYLVIFSHGYASSTWCLRELEKILQCRKQHNKKVIPVFYEVDPTHIRHQTGSFGEGFTKVKAKAKEEQVQRWKDALKEAADLSGRHKDKHKSESQFIEQLVEFVRDELNRMSSSSHDNSKFLVGIDPHVEKVTSSLCLASPQVRSVGLWGMGGVGKTTIAEAVFGSISKQFQSSHFFRNVREELNRLGESAFWNKVLAEILGEKILEERNCLVPDFVWERLARKKVFIVFDDVESSGFLKLEYLKNHHCLFGAGSKILVTSRDSQVLANLKVDETCDEVVGLKMDDALKLFSKQAFHNECPADGFLELSIGVVDYAEGNPLALKVLGSALFAQDKKYWESKLKEMKSFIDKDILNVLRVSFDGLSDAEKEIFLDIACLFQGQDMDEATESLKFSSAYYDSAYSCIINLRNKSLLTISGHNTLGVHHLLQEMSWKIEREQSKRRRLHIPVDIWYLSTNKKAAKEIQSLIIDLSAAKDVFAIDFAASVEMVKKMVNLRVLKVYGRNEEFPEHALHVVSNTLRYIHWELFQNKSLPPTFDVPNLVKISLPMSNIERLDWGQELVNLRWLDLKECSHLVESPDLSKARGIEYLDLSHCGSLRKLHPSTQHLTKLQVLNLKWCYELETLPDKFDSEALRVLNLKYCLIIQRCPEVLGKMDSLCLWGRAIRELPPCCGFKSLRKLKLVCCSDMTQFPDFCTNLERLYLIQTGIEEIPSSVEFLNKLDYLDLRRNWFLSSISSNIWALKSLKTLYLVYNRATPPRIMEVNGSGLRELHVTCSDSIMSLPEGMCNLKSLCILEIRHCRRLLYIPVLPHSLEVLDVSDCPELKTITISNLSKLQSMRFQNCFRLDAMARQQIMQYVRIHQVSLPVEVVLPGTDIPTWFHHTSEGASVTVRLPSINSNPLIGIAFCISIYGSIDDLRIQCIWRANTKDGQNNHLTLRPIFVTRLNCDIDGGVNDEAYNHIALRYLEDRPTMESIHKVFSSKYLEATFEFHLESSESCEVTNCGVYLKFDEKSCERSLEQDNDKVNSCLGPVRYQADVLRAEETQEWHEEHLSVEEEEFYSCDEDS